MNTNDVVFDRAKSPSPEFPPVSCSRCPREACIRWTAYRRPTFSGPRRTGGFPPFNSPSHPAPNPAQYQQSSPDSPARGRASTHSATAEHHRIFSPGEILLVRKLSTAIPFPGNDRSRPVASPPPATPHECSMTHSHSALQVRLKFPVMESSQPALQIKHGFELGRFRSNSTEDIDPYVPLFTLQMRRRS